MSSKAKNFDGPPNLTDSDNDSDSDSESKGDKFSLDNSESDDETFQSDEESIPSLHEQELPDQDPVDTNQDKDKVKAKVVKTSEELRTEGNNLFSKGDHKLAIEKYEDAIKTGKISPEDKVKCYSNICHCYNKLKRYKEGLKAAFKAIELKPNFGRSYQRCAESYINLDKFTMAAIVLMKGIANNANIPNQSNGDKCKQLKEHLDGIK